ncbi:PGF-pre-PGF domain-containing protein [Candidatus Woesearchaeota archaeon]|nr:PGF-pre-PGF domain-containing protein [Candidatus Woesearchaeota archaeon]
MKIFFSISVFLLLASVVIFSDELPDSECGGTLNAPQRYAGQVIYANGTPIQSGNLVNATIGNYHFTTFTDSEGQYGNATSFSISTCDGDSATTITFIIDAKSSNTSIYAEGGDNRIINITAAGVVCGDNTCNGTETTGSTNIFPTCNRDCGATPSSSSSSSGGGGSSSGGGSSGGGGAAAGAKGSSETISTGKISSGATAVAKVTSDAISVVSVEITVNKEVTASSVSVSDTGTDKGTATEAVTAEEGLSVYTYLKITLDKISNAIIDKAVVKFKVPQSAGFDPATVELRRYLQNTRKWQPLATKMTSQDALFYYFEAETPGFSQFAIVGKKVAGAQSEAAGEGPAQCGDGVCGAGENNAGCPSDCKAAEPAAVSEPQKAEGKKGFSGTTIFISIAVAVVLIYFLARKRKRQDRPF